MNDIEVIYAPEVTEVEVNYTEEVTEITVFIEDAGAEELRAELGDFKMNLETLYQISKL